MAALIQVGDTVLLSTQELDPSIQPPKFVGPFRIDQCVSDTSFRLRVPGSMGMEVFQSSSLVRFSGNGLPRQETTPSSGVVDSAGVSDDGGREIEQPAAEKKKSRKENKAKKKLLIIGECVQEQRTASAEDAKAGTTSPGIGYKESAVEVSVSADDGRSASGNESQRRLKRLRKVAETDPLVNLDKVKRESSNGEAQCSGDGERKIRDEQGEHREKEVKGSAAGSCGSPDQRKEQPQEQSVEEEVEEVDEHGMVMVDGQQEWEVEAILEDRVVALDNRRRREYLVKWKGYSVEESTWEPRSHLAHAEKILRAFKRRKDAAAAAAISTV